MEINSTSSTELLIRQCMIEIYVSNQDLFARRSHLNNKNSQNLLGISFFGKKGIPFLA